MPKSLKEIGVELDTVLASLTEKGDDPTWFISQELYQFPGICEKVSVLMQKMRMIIGRIEIEHDAYIGDWVDDHCGGRRIGRRF